MSTRAIAVTTHQIRAASSSPARSAASSERSNASSDAAPPSSQSPRSLPPEGPRGRCRQHRPLRRRPQPPHRPRLVEDAVAPNTDRPTAPARRPKRDQIGFLTDDYLLFEHDLRANAFRVCREGKPEPTFPDLAPAITIRPRSGCDRPAKRQLPQASRRRTGALLRARIRSQSA